MKANHNSSSDKKERSIVVSNGIKDTNLKANHNNRYVFSSQRWVVSNGIKDTNLKANHNAIKLEVRGIMLFPMVSKILI
ncbi:hypothetical protein L0N18_00340 [Phocaeicola dorei]|nr:hypothetical protein [Phocaeicola dorei]MCB6962843.1 hypothetical protein [Phocaeicola dorei]MCG4612035.1 hypothetical protein [Phocaeicola dorei]MCG4635253.1 hypothetical protein [Phocaeicola dorei]